MTYTVKTTMPDGHNPDLLPMTADQVRQYLVSIKAEGWTEESYGSAELPDAGRATATYVHPNDTTIEWSRNAD